MLQKFRIYFLFTTVLALACFNSSFTARAQSLADEIPESIGKDIDQDPEYVKPMREFFALRIYNIVKTTGFSVRNNDLNQRFRFLPNNGLGMGLGFSYRMLALDVGFVIPGTMRYQGDDPYTKFDLLSTLYGKKHVFDLTLQYYEGYFLQNASRFFSPETVGNHNSLRSDIASIDVALSYLYVFNNEKFSFQAAFLGDVIQRKSAGSVTFHGFISLFGLQADSSLVLHDFENDLNQQAHITQVGMLSSGTGIGYAHTIAFPKNFFLTLSGAPLVMLTTTSSEVNNPNYSSGDIDARINIRLFTRSAIGYNSDQFYLIFNIFYDNYFVRFGDYSRIDYAPVKMKLFFGWRFGKLDGKS